MITRRSFLGAASASATALGATAGDPPRYPLLRAKGTHRELEIGRAHV